MITINYYNRPHSDIENIRKGYAFGYSYITRKSKLNAFAEFVFNLWSIRCILYSIVFPASSMKPSYLWQLPWIQLGRNFFILLDNWHEIRACNNDRYNALYNTLVDSLTWLSFLVSREILHTPLHKILPMLYLRVILSAVIIFRFFYYMRNNAAIHKDGFFQNSGHGIVWSLQIAIFFAKHLNII